MATQLYETALQKIPDLEQQLSKGDFKPLRAWLLDAVHRRGSFCASADELMKEVTGRPLDPNVFLEYLNKKYRELYRL